jgi:anti-anti-sigma regulatory factor
MSVRPRFDADGTVTVFLAGTLDAGCIADIDRALESARRLNRPIVIDLGKVRLIDRPTMQYLVDVVEDDVRLANCPDHVERWIVRECTRALNG